MTPVAPPPLAALLRAQDVVTRTGYVLGATALGLIVVIYAYEVVMRYFFAAPTTWASDLVSFLLLISVFLVAPWLARERGHVSVTILPDLLPRGPSHLLLRAGYLIAAIVCFWAGWIVLSENIYLYHRGTTTLTTVEIPKWTLAAFITYGIINTGLHFLRLIFGVLPEANPELKRSG